MKHDTEEKHIRNKELKFKLTKDDIARKATEAAKISLELTAHRIHSAVVRGELRDKEGSLETNLSETLNVISDGFELRYVNCVERKDFTTNKVEYMFEDQVIESRVMTGSELQREIPFPKREKTDGRMSAAGKSPLDDEPETKEDVDVINRASLSDPAKLVVRRKRPQSVLGGANE